MAPSTHWHKATWLACLLWVFSLLFRALVGARRHLYRCGVFSVYRSSLPVIVVGNITVGGTGKTPLTIGIVKYLRARGYSPAVVSRGYRSERRAEPVFVERGDQAVAVGDEPLLIATSANVPVVTCRNRSRAVAAIEQRGGSDVILSDDGLQHYRMHRDIEVVCIDGERLFGNGLCLPAGPLREPPARLQSADFVVSKMPSDITGDSFELRGQALLSLDSPEVSRELAVFTGQWVHAVAGIANPTAFFALLRTHGLQLIEHAFADHHAFAASDLAFAEELPLIMTEKDALKCGGFGLHNAWYLPVEVVFHSDFYARLERALQVCRTEQS